MADTDDKKKEDAKVEKKDSSGQAGTKMTAILTWIIMITVVALLAGSGFVLGRLFAGSSSSEPNEPSKENTQTEKTTPKGSGKGLEATSESWYYNELESIVVNPDEPGATRFVRIGLILEISSGLSKEKAKEIFEEKKPPLISWLNLYFKGLSLDQMKNDKDMQRILSQICDAFNEILFPDAKPQIKKVLIREFNIQ